ncbi:hypothetical protein [Roseibium polysiphoniae]|uniref:hypothetical protein n=1 Tax=Roseibium polysiphoniae TaxID=2571221 RepID=UPI003296E907
MEIHEVLGVEPVEATDPNAAVDNMTIIVQLRGVVVDGEEVSDFVFGLNPVTQREKDFWAAKLAEYDATYNSAMAAWTAARDEGAVPAGSEPDYLPPSNGSNEQKVRAALAFWLAEEGNEIPEYTPPPPTTEEVIEERARRLAQGLEYDFGDVRGVHKIGTTEADMAGWDEVAKGAQAAINLGASGSSFTIVTETGPATVTAIEFQAILAAATAFRQPIWASSFALQVMDPIPANYADDVHWP